MPKGDMKPLRPSRKPVKKATEEHHSNTALDLAKERIHALDEESRKRMERITPDEKTKGAG